MTRPSRDQVYIEMAMVLATRSTCPRRSVGCILTDQQGRILSMGYNGVASGRPHCNDGFPCPGVEYPSGQGLDACEAIHAEQNAILHLPDPFRVHTAYVTATPCHSCMKLLLGTSCKRLVCCTPYPHTEALRWWREAGRDYLQINIPNAKRFPIF